MGKFIYDGNIKVDFEDRLLAHLQAVIMAKVRRGESFPFTWKDDISIGGGRTTVYIHPNVSMVFKYHGSRNPQLSSSWLHALTYNANSGRGLYVIPEPDDSAHHESAPREQMVFREVPNAQVPMAAHS
ncbi:ATP-dependent DNA ligase [Microbacterium enclense]|uniref:ATP-dependent DNA ligase n=1 Tax=Microbacterium enclense TaxID=993073 RepID=A0A3S3P1C9_9MICO|nr:ATP-dependent DNA ligase [Microbacterium enclense]RWR15800.1 ATP-dependent DNA ligase [Microbacterium enclense]